MVEYHSISARDPSRLHQFGRKVLPDMLLGYVVIAGGMWTGDILVADVELNTWTRWKSVLEGSM